MCYAGPLAGAVISHTIWSRTKSVKVWWLTLMFYGGALFGVVDHWWNGELFLISDKIARDLLLGVAISAIILLVWGVMLRLVKVNPTLASYTNIAK
jgi:hypothetical protein